MFNSVFFCASVLRDNIEAISKSICQGDLSTWKVKKKSSTQWIGKLSYKHIGGINMRNANQVKKKLGMHSLQKKWNLKINMIFNLNVSKVFKEINEEISWVERRHFGVKRSTNCNKKRWVWKIYLYKSWECMDFHQKLKKYIYRTAKSSSERKYWIFTYSFKNLRVLDLRKITSLVQRFLT